MGKSFHFSYLKERVISSLYVLGICGVFWGMIESGWLSLNVVFRIGLFFLLVMSLFEWGRAFGVSQMFWRQKELFVLGLAYLLLAFRCAFLLLDKWGPFSLFQVVVFCMMSDSLAYFAGSFFKGPLLSPQISPVKTWSGAIASWLGCFVLFWFWPIASLGLSVAVFLPIVMQSGDLIESYAKRRLKIKDMGSILKGHGGVLDRIDSWLSAFIFLGLFLL